MYQVEENVEEKRNQNVPLNGITSIGLPFNLEEFNPTYFKIKLYETALNEPVIVDDQDHLLFLAGKAHTDDFAFNEWKAQNRLLESILPGDFAKLQDDFPSIKISDVTERDMFGYVEIPQDNLDIDGDKGGIWACHGLRKFEIKTENLPYDENNKTPDKRQRAAMYFFKMNNNELSDFIIVDDIRFNRKRNVYVAYVNTELFGEKMSLAQNNQPLFSGRFEFHISDISYKYVYSFPVDVKVHDTRLNENFTNHLLKSDIVSIDFGTSSTCAAIIGQHGHELITLSGEKKIDPNGNNNQYENPTNLMIYDWNEFYRQWKHDNTKCPFLVTKSKELDEREADYDSGYTVDKILTEINEDDRGKRRAEAIITGLKFIPAMNATELENLKIWSLNEAGRSFVYLTDDVDKENKQNLDPIAFYGFLLSRAINNPIRSTIYNLYKVTFPAKFSKEVRQKIRKSLAYGIRRALPSPMAKAQNNKSDPFVEVAMEYEESVACVGAIVANQLVISEESSEAKPFAVFDLGGGTLDTTYGIFRNAIGAENDKANFTIQIFGCGGNKRIGGENLIHQLAYKIYLDNHVEMKRKNIPFVLPVYEQVPRDFDGFDNLLNEANENANANIRALMEKIARPLFQYKDNVDNCMNKIFSKNVAPDTTHCKIRLRKIDGTEEELTLEVTGVDEFLRAKIEHAVVEFKEAMNQICTAKRVLDALQAAGIDATPKDYHPEKFSIFLGGNASKQRYVEEIMQVQFPDNQVERIEKADEKDLSDRYRLNGKTAVAFGQLKLRDYFIDRSAYLPDEVQGAPFQYKVGFNDPGTGKFKTVLSSNENSHEWKRANRVHDGRLELFYTDAASGENLTPFQRAVIIDDDKNGNVLWIRVAPNAHNSIEYRIGKQNSNFAADEPQDNNRVLQLPQL